MEKDKIQTTIETYNNITQEYIDFYKSNILNETITLNKELDYLVSKLNSNSIILDAGTAIGEYPRYLTEKYNKNFNVIGIDTSENMLKKATDFAPKAKFLQMDIRDLKFNSNTFDAIICFATLIHVDDKTCINVLNKFDDILKEEGIIAINVMEHLKGEKEIFIKEPFNENYIDIQNNSLLTILLIIITESIKYLIKKYIKNLTLAKI